MSLRAIFRFENLDSTRDLNDRFKGIILKGVYEGGIVKANATGNAAIIEPFKAITDDGMTVESTEDIVVQVPYSAVNLYIVLEAYYVMGEAPVMNIKVIDNVLNIDPARHIKLAKKIGNTTYDYTNDDCADRISPVGRNHFRGVLTNNEFEVLADSFAKKDWCFVVAGSSVTIQLKKPDGTFAYYASTDIIAYDIDSHESNTIVNVSDNDTSMGKAGSNGGMPTIVDPPLVILDGNTQRECDIGEESYGSFNITSDKWFSLEDIRNRYRYSDTAHVGSNRQKVVYHSLYLSGFINQYYIGGVSGSSTEGTHSRGIRFNNIGILAPDQKPSESVRFITENYPLIPSLDEKFALVGNYDEDEFKPSKDNRFLTQKTGCLRLKTYTFSSRHDVVVSSGITYSYYELPFDDTDNRLIYIKSISEQGKYIKPIVKNYLGDTVDICLCTYDGSTYTPITSSSLATVIDDGLLPGWTGTCIKNSTFYVRIPTANDILDGIYYYSLSDLRREKGIIRDELNTTETLFESTNLVSNTLWLKTANNNQCRLVMDDSGDLWVQTTVSGTSKAYKVMLIDDGSTSPF